jgi:hypothetical protein
MFKMIYPPGQNPEFPPMQEPPQTTPVPEPYPPTRQPETPPLQEPITPQVPDPYVPPVTEPPTRTQP